MNQKSDKRPPRLTLLGWGSLIWDSRPEFDRYRGDWQVDGPVLPLEFSRVSESRKGALTLVIDPRNGSLCQTAFALSKRQDPDDAIADLRCREGTIMKRMGFYFVDNSRSCTPEVPETVAPWALKKGFDVVIWTGLQSNFKQETGKDFSIDSAIDHLQRLPPKP
jgi:hypothetical protein